VYRRLVEVPGPIDLVNVFRRPRDLMAHVDDILAKRRAPCGCSSAFATTRSLPASRPRHLRGARPLPHGRAQKAHGGAVDVGQPVVGHPLKKGGVARAARRPRVGLVEDHLRAHFLGLEVDFPSVSLAIT